ncbi:TPA: phage tail protein [Neisseria meningitidis]|uniref:phage tail protein n=1 Tax=Neisseria meningitidis TaxID=487 RepID=UPI000766A1B7|nr:phage tail protein [Neisseria meningitidis]CWN45144.1 Tail completion protein R (GpR) [Neisseria meningitidis]CWR19306.1 Tail completion protein R (GpR) [Neisseria meningitidis]
MKKPESLRAALAASLPEFADAPDRLRLTVFAGQVVPKRNTLSFETKYTLNVFVREFHRDPALLFLVVNQWLQENQRDILCPGADASARAFVFEAEPIEADVWDIMIELKLTETVIAGLDDEGKVVYKTKSEPPRQDF